ncbi:hypothetical protein IV203_017852 [Nitzschia inconspicua]|uniref:Uncharacterized protein n=1 Tax=Nitzschia inconspicua TaxID=303405 RepID=A0A9K3KFC1_9STRA|nr:hypothetical protein IV203_020551 [Nitzschia inconspicua]KAG7371711.1 hypothetical protein IV203_017852 [Nitzschia inconspicua]
MDSTLAYFKGFFSLEDDEDDRQTVEPIEYPSKATTISKADIHTDNDQDLEIGKSTGSKKRGARPKSSSASTDSSVSAAAAAAASSKSNSEPRMMSFLTDVFAFLTAPTTTATDDIPVEGPKLKTAPSSSSSSYSFPGQSVGARSRAFSRTNSDTSSTQSSGEENDNLPSTSRSGRNRNRPHRTTRRELLAMISDDASLQPLPHIQLMAHGQVWTCVGIIATWIGFALSYSTWNSTAFASLTVPLFIDSVWNEVTDIGMHNLKLCYNTTFDSTAHSDGECTSHQLGSQEIDDTMFQTARSMAFLAVLFGGFLSFFLSTAAFWRSINLRPIGVGYLLAYFFQSLTFLYFDADLCAEHQCTISVGGKLSAVASLCWIVTCIAAARMDSYKFQKTLEWVQESDFRLSYSRSRSQSPQKSIRSSSPRKPNALNKKELRRETTDGTAPLSVDSFESSSEDDRTKDDKEMVIETTWRRPKNGHANRSSSSHSGRRFASNGCEIIQGIQDRQAVEAWAARSPKAVSTNTTVSDGKNVPSPRATSAHTNASTSKKSTSSSVQTQIRSNRRNRPTLTIDTSYNDANESLMSSTITSVGTPILPSRQDPITVRRPESPSKPINPSRLLSSSARIDYSGHRAVSPSKSRSSRHVNACATSNPGAMLLSQVTTPSKTSPLSLTSSSPSASKRKQEMERQLDELDALVQQSTPMQRDKHNKSRLSSTPSPSSSGRGRKDRSSSSRVSRRLRDADGAIGERHDDDDDGVGRSSSRSQSRRRSSSSRTPQGRHHDDLSSLSERRSVVFNFLEENETGGNQSQQEQRSTSRRARAYRSPQNTLL